MSKALASPHSRRKTSLTIDVPERSSGEGNRQRHSFRSAICLPCGDNFPHIGEETIQVSTHCSSGGSLPSDQLFEATTSLSDTLHQNIEPNKGATVDNSITALLVSQHQVATVAIHIHASH